MSKKYLILPFVAAMLTFNGSAQDKNVEKQDILWTRYLLKMPVNEKWSPFFDVEERLYLNSLRQHHFLPSLGATYKLDQNFSITAAMMYFELTLPQDPEADFKEIQQELRPQIALNFKHKINEKWTYLSRFKVEWRYKKRPAEEDFSFSNYRFRMRMGVKYQINQKFTAKLLEEIHFNVGKNIVRNVFDQNRLSAGINYKINDQFQVESGYLYWFQQSSTGDDFFSRNIAYLTLKHNLNLF